MWYITHGAYRSNWSENVFFISRNYLPWLHCPKSNQNVPRYNMKSRGKRDTTQNIPRCISFSHLHFVRVGAMCDSLTSLFTKEQSSAIHSQCSLQKSNVIKLLSLLFKKERCEYLLWIWADSLQKMSDSLKINLFMFFDSFSPFWCPTANCSCRSLLLSLFAPVALCSFTLF